MAKHTPGYEVTQSGRVFSVSSNWRGYGCREMTQHPNSDGYMRVRLIINGIRKSYFVHKLVAAKYLPPCPSPAHEIRHWDGDKTNNGAENLLWGTPADNAADRARHGRTSRGETHSLAVKAGIQKSTNSYWRHAR
jgi:hypothetical protein